ncbi:HipA N-terminal domain-containing protein [uncultured Capnocytophaga sp.]|uniref:HipA N-terminal domain-containing protein n=1 Tax=uncultured Capnocytophaga sp. TaxID=159273 RepID=UPI0028E3888E|nr:HipA N-terminal domain-containing protein [uncultured Capnocytophaga sp.]
MKQAVVYYKNELAGLLTEDEEGYHFAYTEEYLSLPQAKPISLTLPLQSTPYHSSVLFPFFDGLIPEGWLLQIAINNWKLNPRDRFALLLAMCKDCIGCVSIISKNEE